MKTISLKEVENGFFLKVEDKDSITQYAFRSVDILPMLEFIGRKILNPKWVRVTAEEK